MARAQQTTLRGFTAILLCLVCQTGLGQAAALPRIGFLSLLSLESDTRLPAFIAGLKDFGYVEGKTIHIDWRSARGNAAELPALASELVARKVDLILAVQPQAVEAARRATSTIPIVFAVAQDPIGMGFAKSLSAPGGNITGTSLMVSEMAPKQLELMRTTLAKSKKFAIVLNPTNPAGSNAMRSSFQKAVGDLQIVFLDASDDDEINKAFLAARTAGAAGVVFGPDSYFIQARSMIAAAALRHKLPTMFTQREQTLAGGMMSYGPSVSANYRRAAYYVNRILKGAKASELPIEQPTTFELVINLKTAKALGIPIPKSILARADSIIE
ncbi:MAG: hypothetical protein QOD26_2829 [Betaproteobacteria bacterium]|jgi:putative ABC transport system substrate-binding protein|nr:hypothetical protein [Betaproteobacteria bacterium]